MSSSHVSDPDEKPVHDKDLQSELTEAILKLEEIDKNLYRGSHLWKPLQGRAVFGGQVVGQALVAAGMTKDENVHIHSMHCYFVRPGKVDRPILYHVDVLRNGISFATRSVKAVQNGEAILTMMVSYHKTEPSPIEHQFKMPEVPSPEDLEALETIMKGFLESDSISDRVRQYIKRSLANEVPIDIKPVEQHEYFRYGVKEPKHLLWIKAKGNIGDNSNLHRCVAAYMSDWTLLRAALYPFPNFRTKMMASLDHAMWFHTTFRADEWMLYECESPKTGGARGFTLGRLWRRDGTLAVSVAQEGVIRGVLNAKM